MVGSDDGVDGNSVNGRTVLAVVASRGCVAIYFLAYRFSFPSSSLWQTVDIHCKNIRRLLSIIKITGNQLPVYFPLFFTGARKHFQASSTER